MCSGCRGEGVLWGDNTYNALTGADIAGCGGESNRAVPQPVRVNHGKTYRSIAAAGREVCAIAGDRPVCCWRAGIGVSRVRGQLVG